MTDKLGKTLSQGVFRLVLYKIMDSISLKHLTLKIYLLTNYWNKKKEINTIDISTNFNYST